MKDFKKKLIEKLPELKRHAMIESTKYLKDSEMDADDLLNETVKKALIKQHKFDDKYFLAYLKKMMTHLAIDEHRKNSIKVELKGEELEDALATGQKTYKKEKREVSYENEKPDDAKDNDKKMYLSDFNPESASPSESSSFNKKTEQDKLESEEELNIMNNCLNKMSEKCKEILLLWGAGYKYKEISERLSIPMGTTMTNISRCRKKLKECIQNTQLLGENNEI